MGKHKDNSMVLFGVAMLVSFLVVILKFGGTWPGWVVASAMLGMLLAGLIVYRPSIAKDLIDAIGDRIRGKDDNGQPPTAPAV